jgi:hypothetical protein
MSPSRRSQKISNVNFSRYALAAAAIGSVAGAQKAGADFSGPYTLNPPANGTYTQANAAGTFGNWTSTLGLTTSPSSDAIVTNAPVSVQLQLGNSQVPFVTDNFDLTTTIQGGGTVSFNWNFVAGGGAPAGSGFGYLLNGAFTSLATGTSAASFSSVPVNAGDVFGFRLSANYNANDNVTITNFSAPVPEPSIVMLVASGAFALVALREVRRRRAARR